MITPGEKNKHWQKIQNSTFLYTGSWNFYSMGLWYTESDGAIFAEILWLFFKIIPYFLKLGKFSQARNFLWVRLKLDLKTEFNSNITFVSFDSTLSSHFFENPSHKILFEESVIINNDQGIKQVVQEAIKSRLKINNMNIEPVTNRPMRSAAKKARLALKTCF